MFCHKYQRASTLGVLEIEEEHETEESLMKRGNAFKYMYEYIRQNRYIGVYSNKNQNIFEIDTSVMCVKNREIVFGDETVYAIAHELYTDTGLLIERTEESREVFLLY